MMIEAHICSGGKVPGILRPYCALACSLCHDGTTIVVPRDIIDDYNEKVRNPPEKPIVINWPSIL